MTTLRTQDQIIQWLRSHFERKIKGKNQAALARALGKNRSAVTAILSGKRHVKADELAAIKEFFDAPSQEAVRERPISGEVPVVGRVGENVWHKATDRPDVTRYVGSVASDYPIEDQIAFEIIETSADGKLSAGDVVFGVAFDKYRASPRPRDVIIVKVQQGAFIHFALRKAISSPGGVQLVPLARPGSSSDDRAETRSLQGRDALAETPYALLIGVWKPVGSL